MDEMRRDFSMATGALSPACKDLSVNRTTEIRRGATSWPIVVVMLSAVMLVLLIASMGVRPSREAAITSVEQEPLIVYCAASNKSGVEAVRQDYEREFGTPVRVQF